jgi:type VI secretion system secreted protein Hcp
VPVDMFLKLGPIKGEAKDSKHKQEIDIISWAWGASNSSTTHVGGGGGGGKVHVHDLSVTKYVDIASPALHLAVWNGKHIDEAWLYSRKAGEKPLEYLIIHMKEVLVTAVTIGGSGGEDRFTENLTLNFAKVQIEYKEQSDSGGAAGNPKSGWDVTANGETTL